MQTQKSNLTKLFQFVLALALVASSVFVASEAIAAYQRTADNTVPAYTNPELTQRNGNERVDRGDVVTVFEERGNAYYVRYPTSRGTKDRWVPKSIFNDNNGGGNGNISPSGYAYPLGRATSFGNGHDCAIAEGTPVYAIADGTANFYQVMGTYNGRYSTVSYGNYIELNCDNGATGKYAHLSRFEGVSLQYDSSKNYGSTYTKCKNYGKKFVGSRRVSKGDVIGYVGTTGNSSGPHLHFEFYENGNRRNVNDYFNR